MANVILKGINKTYDKSVVAVKDLDLEVKDKEFIVLVGPSGCGKSTTLRMIAGLESITQGEIYIADKLVNEIEPKDRDIAMVFQNYALYPHMSVYDNLAFALKMRKMKKDEIEKLVNKAARILNIEELLKRKPKQLSGGQRQRVAIGRAIVRDPQVFLMDEPLSNLDAKLRNQMRAELIKLHKDIDTTFIYVTHDQTEAMTLGTRIVVMKDGVIQQTDTPQNIFESPANIFVAGFIGTPQMNFFKNAQLVIDNGVYGVKLFGRTYALPEEKQAVLRASKRSPGKVVAGVRPEDFMVAYDEKGFVEVNVDVSELLGSEVVLHVTLSSNNGEKAKGESIVEQIESEVILRIKSESFDSRNPALKVIPNLRKIHLFDIDTEENILNQDSALMEERAI